MSPFRKLALAVLCLAPFVAHAQTSTLQPFTLSGKSWIQARGEAQRRVPTGLTMGVMARNSSPYAMGASMVGTVDAAQREVNYSGQVPRDLNGTLLEFYPSYSAVTNFPPYITYQGNRVYYEAFPHFTAPQTGNLTRDVAFTDLCSLTVEVQGLVAGEDISSLQVEAESGVRINSGYPVTARAEFSGNQVAGTDPKVVTGFVSTTSGGRETARIEALVGNNRTYKVDVYTSFAGTTARVKSTGTIAINDANCTNATFVTTAKLPQEKITGSYWLKRDNAYAAGPSVSRYELTFAAFDWATRANANVYTSTANLTPTGDSAVSYSVNALQSNFRAWGSGGVGPKVYLTWPDGRGTASFALPGSGELYTPLATASSKKGVYPNGDIIVSADEVETVSFTQEMAFADGRLLINGCSELSDVASGTVSMFGSQDTGPNFTDELGKVLASQPGTFSGLSQTPLVRTDGTFQLVGVAGPWTENAYNLALVRGAGPDADDYLSQTFAYYPNRSYFTLVPRHANAVDLTRDIPMGAVTVNLRVRNTDGSYRQFKSPELTARYGHTDAALQTLAQVYGLSTGSSTLRDLHKVTIVGPPGTATIDAAAQVPANADGTGAFNRSSFPPLTNVRFRAPRPGGACAATCAVFEADGGWHYYDDDRTAPVITLGRLPSSTRAASIDISGLVTDESPVEVTINGVAATVSGTPTSQSFSGTVNLSIGNNGITVVVTDRCGGTQTSSIKITRQANNPPTLTVPGTQTVFEGDPVSFTVVGADPDRDPLTYAVTGPTGFQGATLNATSGAFAIPSDTLVTGTYDFTFSVTDGVDTASKPVRVVVERRVPAKLVFTVQPQTTTAGSQMAAVKVALHDANNVLCASATNAITLVIGTNPGGGTLSGTRTVAAVAGVATYTTLSVDKAGVGYTLDASSPGVSGSGSKRFDILGGKPDHLAFLVQPSDSAVHQPVAPAVEVGVFDAFDNLVAFEEPITLELAHPTLTGVAFGGTLAAPAPSGVASFGDLTVGSGGEDFLLIASTEALGSARSDPFDVLDTAPVIGGDEEVTVLEGEPLTVPLTATDADGDAVVLTVTHLPDGASFDPLTGLVTWTPDFEDAGDYTLTLEATANGVTTTTTLVIHVVDVNRPPVLAPIGARTVLAGDTLTFATPATDPDGDTLSWSATGLPTGAAYEGATFTWTPERSQEGPHTVRITVNDGRGGEDFEDVVITVIDPNRAPEFEPVDEIETDGPGGFTYVVTDPDGDVLTCTAVTLPPGATLDAETGTITWKDTITPAGSYTATITCSDGELEDTLDVKIRARVFDRVGGGLAGCSSTSGASLLAVFAVFAFALRRRRAAL